MALFLISYDLIKPEKDYPDLLKTLRSAAKRVLYSEWIMDSDSNASDIFDWVHSEGKLDNDDKLLVVQVGDWASINLMTAIKDI